LGSIYKSLGAGKDKIFKINLATGDTINVGATGFGTLVNGIFFDESGGLYGVKGGTFYE